MFHLLKALGTVVNLVRILTKLSCETVLLNKMVNIGKK